MFRWWREWWCVTRRVRRVGRAACRGLRQGGRARKEHSGQRGQRRRQCRCQLMRRRGQILFLIHSCFCSAWRSYEGDWEECRRGNVRRVDGGDFLAVRRWHPLIVDEEACWLDVCVPIWSCELSLQRCRRRHFSILSIIQRRDFVTERNGRQRISVELR